MKTIGLTLVALVIAGCSQEISRQEFHERGEELTAEMFAGRGGEAVREARELAVRPPDRALRDSAEVLVGEIEGLYDEVIALREEILERTPPGPKIAWRSAFLRLNLTPRERADARAAAAAERAATAVDEAAERRSGAWQEIRVELAGETIEAVDNGMRRGALEKLELMRWLESDRARLAELSVEAVDQERESVEEDLPAQTEPAARRTEEMSREAVTAESPTTTERGELEAVVEAQAETPTPAEPDPEPAPSEPTPEEIREAAAAAVEALDPLYDELVVELEAIEAAHADAEQKRRARSQVTMARFAKGREMESLRRDVGAEQMFRVTGAWRRVENIRARLEREIAEAREILRGLGSGLQRAQAR